MKPHDFSPNKFLQWDWGFWRGKAQDHSKSLIPTLLQHALMCAYLPRVASLN